ncbi:MAG TPA: outer membrane beta-barrel protein [Polyangiaceae bacterium]
MPRSVLAAAGASLVVSLAHTAAAADSRFEIGGYGAYTTAGSAEAESELLTSTAHINDGPSYGAFLDVLVRRGAFAELSYSRQDTQLEVRISDGTRASYDLLIQHVHVGGLLEFRSPSAEWFRPVFGGTIGASIYGADDDGRSYEEWRLSLIFEGGAKFQLGSRLGLRFRARLLTTFLADDSAVFCATGAGCAFAYSGVPVFQGEFGAGAYLAF